MKQWFIVFHSAPVRLGNGSVVGEGRVEVYDASRRMWGQVCNDTWDLPAGNVLCRQLGFREVASSTSNLRAVVSFAFLNCNAHHFRTIFLKTLNTYIRYENAMF